MNYDLNALEFDKILSTLASYVQTEYAKETIKEIQPINELSKVHILLNETYQAFNNIVKFQTIPLGGLNPVKESIQRARIGSILSEYELINVISLINVVSTVINYFKQLQNIKLPLDFLEKYFNNLILLNQLKSNINLSISEDGKVLDNASKELFMVRKGLSSAYNRLRIKMNDLLISKSSILNDNIIAIRNDRMCLPVKVEYKNTFKGIVHDESSSGTTCYIEPESCIEINASISTLTNKERKEVEIILKNLSLLVSADADSLLYNLDMLTKLDIIYAKAAYAYKEDYHMPNINDNGYIELKNAKHPLISKSDVVPIDINIGKKFNTIIITGPNTGGKTVTLKTVGLLSVMTQSGMFIPASHDSHIAIFDNILVDIGDEQSIEQSLSTFSSHMTKIINILNNINSNSLVLLDELGSGTDPKEGSSLAISIIEFLKKTNARTIATTHYSDLKEYAYNSTNISNASVEFNIQTLKPTYRLLMGIPGKSNAIEIAKRLGLNNLIIESARTLLTKNSNDSDNLMTKLDEERDKIREKEEDLNKLIDVYKNKLLILNEQKNDLEKRSNKIIGLAKNEANKILEKAKEDATILLNEINLIKEGNHKEHELADIKYKVRNLSTKNDDVPLFEENIVIDDHVFIKSYNKNGIVTDIKKDKYIVSIGQFSMTFSKNELKKIEKQENKIIKEIKFSGYNPASHAVLSLDLRGKRFEELEYELDLFIDQAQLGNIKQVTIIHGFGSGVVRKYVQDYLKKCSIVNNYRYGGEGEGLNGATIVTFK